MLSPRLEANGEQHQSGTLRYSAKLFPSTRNARAAGAVSGIRGCEHTEPARENKGELSTLLSGVRADRTEVKALEAAGAGRAAPSPSDFSEVLGHTASSH